jgi:hypothetical protein
MTVGWSGLEVRYAWINNCEPRRVIAQRAVTMAQLTASEESHAASSHLA